MKGPKAKAVMERAQKGLLRERISEIIRKLKSFKSQIAEADEFLFTELDSNLYTEVKSWMAHAQDCTFQRVRSKQQQKFARLQQQKLAADKVHNGPITQVDDEERKQITSKWVVNLSDRTLSEEEKSVLERGLNPYPSGNAYTRQDNGSNDIIIRKAF